MPKATVVIPTFVHGPTLYRSVSSALEQTIEDIEVFVIGDGVPDVTREIVTEMASGDPRVRFFDNPKGARVGEVHRHAALAEATGDIVCYLSDDDLWLPQHVANMLEMLEGADFTHCLSLNIQPAGGIATVHAVDHAVPQDRALSLAGTSRVHLSCAGHTLAMYRQLPYGWRPAPPEIYSDLYMWQQFLAHPGCRAVSGTQPTALVFPSPPRADWTIEARCAELDLWRHRAADAVWRESFVRDVLDWVIRDRAALAMTCRNLSAFHAELGSGWSPLQARNGEAFRWVDNDAELVARAPATARQVLHLELESGPGLGRQPFELQVLDEAERIVAKAEVTGRQVIELDLPTTPGRPAVFHLHVAGAAKATQGKRRESNFRVFRANLVSRPCAA